MVYTQHSPREKAGLGRTILKIPLTEVSTPNDDSTTSVSNEAITDSPDTKFDQLAELVRKLSENIESSEKKPQPLEKEIKPASSSSTKSKATSKPKMRSELCNYTTHTTDECYRILFCMICKKDDHRTSDHLSYTVSSSVVSYHNAQSHNYASGSKQIRQKAKPFTPCTHSGFNDHLPDDCLMYPCCDICGDPTHDSSGHEDVIQSRRGITKPTQQSTSSPRCKICGSNIHTTTDHGSISQFKKAIKAKPTRKWVHKKN